MGIPFSGEVFNGQNWWSLGISESETFNLGLHDQLSPTVTRLKFQHSSQDHKKKNENLPSELFHIAKLAVLTKWLHDGASIQIRKLYSFTLSVCFGKSSLFHTCVRYSVSAGSYRLHATTGRSSTEAADYLGSAIVV